ncbi:GNAT family N-acetyltransferase [Zooshikella harenae]|uniref:GNAT family N-acetyltransferase n=1 Tax=Zooshikella harenae TaxID=2827238 RepID=A0ABS5ZA75_9GAMM|nr:GNAT family N-acetyltransferase [Zooshikella harenae]MBU2710946.1 GNAT family N-acetyltransferase [Zooshikella harenae]
MFRVKQLKPVEYPLVNRFYKVQGYKGKARGNENIFVLQQSQIVAALRLVPLTDQWLLRGLWVDYALRRQGLGLALLNGIIDFLTISHYYCFADQDVVPFYLKAEFISPNIQTLPVPILQRFKAYQQRNARLQALIWQSPSSLDAPLDLPKYQSHLPKT